MSQQPSQDRSLCLWADSFKNIGKGKSAAASRIIEIYAPHLHGIYVVSLKQDTSLPLVLDGCSKRWNGTNAEFFERLVTQMRHSRMASF